MLSYQMKDYAAKINFNMDQTVFKLDKRLRYVRYCHSLQNRQPSSYEMVQISFPQIIICTKNFIERWVNSLKFNLYISQSHTDMREKRQKFTQQMDYPYKDLYRKGKNFASSNPLSSYRYFSRTLSCVWWTEELHIWVASSLILSQI